MSTHSLAARLLAAAALLSAPAAFAAGWQGEVGIGTATDAAAVIDLAFGYRFTPNVGVRAMFAGELSGNRIGAAEEPSFRDITGLEATGHAEISPQFNVMGGLGAGRVSYDHAFDGASKDSETTPVLSAGLQWHPRQHFAMELHVDYLSAAEVTNVALMFQIPF
jgi:opacity protein-like surface antigen